MTIREIRPIVGSITYSVSCARCGAHVADFDDPERADDAVEHYGGEIVVKGRYIDDCVVACQGCKDKCLCPKCGKLLADDLCPDACSAPQGIDEFIELYPQGDILGMSVITCAVVIDILPKPGIRPTAKGGRMPEISRFFGGHHV